MVNKEKFKKYFIPNPAYFTFWTKQAGYSKQKHQHREITNKEIELHLEGRQGIGMSPFINDTDVKFGVIDIDIKDKELLLSIIKELVKIGLYPNVFESKSKGHHLYILPSKPIKATVMRYNLKRIITDDVAIRDDKIIVEVFPKQDRVTETGGSKVNLPLFGESRKQLSYDGKPLSRFSIYEIDIEKFKVPEEKKKIDTKEEKPIVITDSYPCIERALQGVSEGERDEWGLELVRFMASKEYPSAVIDSAIHSWNNKNTPPLSKEQLQKLIRQGEKYKSKNVPNCNSMVVKLFCNKKKCRKASLILCEDPYLIKKKDGYYIDGFSKEKGKYLRKATNFTFEVIKADKGTKEITIKIIQGNDEGYVIIQKPNLTWPEFGMLCGFERLVCDGNKISLSFILSAELSISDKDVIIKTDVIEMDYEKTIAFLYKDIKRGRTIPKVEEGVEITKGEILSGWRNEQEIYLRPGPFCERHRLNPKDLAKILNSNGVIQKNMRPPIKGHHPIKVWVIIVEEEEKQKSLLDV